MATPTFYRKIRYRVRRYLRSHDIKREVRLIIPRLIEKITGRPRYLPNNLDWDSPLFTSYLFRAWQWLAYIPCGENGIGDTIRREATVAVYHDEDGVVHIERNFYTLEAFVTHIEGSVRLAISNAFDSLAEALKDAFTPQPQYGFIPQPVLLTIMFLGLKLNLSGDLNGWIAPFIGMAIAHDSSNKGVGVSSALSVSLTCSGSDRLAILGGVLQDNSRSWSDMTYAGVSATQIGSNFLYSANNAPAQLRYLIAPSTGTNNAVFTPSGSINVGGYISTYTGCKQTGQVDASAQGNGSASFNVNVVASNCWIVAGCITFNNDVDTPAAPSYITLAAGVTRWVQATDDNFGLADSNGTVATGNVAVQFSNLKANNGRLAASIAPTTNVDVTVSATVLTATTSIPAPSISGGATVSPTAPVATFSTPAPDISGGANVAPNALTATFSIPAPNIITPDAQVDAGVLTANLSIPAPDVSGAANGDAGVQTLTLSIPTSSVQIDATIDAGVLVATFTTPAPTIDAISNITVSPSPLTATFSIPAPTLTTEQNAVAEVGVLTATFSIPTPTVTAIMNVSVAASVLTATFSVQAPTKVGGVWTAQPRVNGDAAWTPQPRAV